MKELKFITNNEKETKDLAKKISLSLPLGSVCALLGDLGAGKTTFVRGVAEALHIKEVIQSPTFNIMKLYLKGDRPLIHIDAYRLADVNSDIGLDEYIGYETGITMIEWPMFIKDLLPSDSVEINIKNIDENKREITVKGDESFLEKIK